MGHTLCSPVYIQGTNSVGTLFVLLYIYWGQIVWAHSSSPIYIYREVKSVGHTLHPLYIYREVKSAGHTLYPLFPNIYRVCIGEKLCRHTL